MTQKLREKYGMLFQKEEIKSMNVIRKIIIAKGENDKKLGIAKIHNILNNNFYKVGNRLDLSENLYSMNQSEIEMTIGMLRGESARYPIWLAKLIDAIYYRDISELIYGVKDSKGKEYDVTCYYDCQMIFPEDDRKILDKFEKDHKDMFI